MLRSRATVTGTLVLEAVLVVALVSAAVFGLFKTVLSPAGLGSQLPGVVRDAGVGVLGDRYFGEVPAVRAELAVAVTTSPPLYVYGSGEIPKGRGEFSGPYEAQVNAYDPSLAQRAAFLGAGLVDSAATILVLLLMLRLVRTLRAGDPFVLANARRLTRVAIIVAAGGTGASLLSAWGDHLVLSDAAIQPLVREQLDVSLLPIVAGLGIFLLAEVFRRGALMRRDLEGLV